MATARQRPLDLKTKHLGSSLPTHVITKNGRLLLEQVNRIDYELETRTTSRRDANFDGTFRFYGGDTREWHEYNAKFVHGQLVSIERDMRMTDQVQRGAGSLDSGMKPSAFIDKMQFAV